MDEKIRDVELEDLTPEQRVDVEEKIKRYLNKIVPAEKRLKKPESEEIIERKNIIEERKPEKQAFDLSKNQKFDKHENFLIGKYLLRDLPFFKFEMIVYFGLLLIGILVWYMDVREFFPGISRLIFIPTIAVPPIIWFIKSRLFMPRKNRVPGARLYKSGIVELGVFDITKGYILFGHGDDVKKKFITKINKHIEASTGRPFVVVSELEGENLNLLKTDQPDMRSDEFNALLEMNTMVTTKNVMARMLRFAQPKLSSPLMILQMISICVLVVIALKLFGLFELFH